MTEHRSHAESVKGVWRTTVILSVVTIIEVLGALYYPESAPKLLLNLFLIIMTILKAFYIIAEFMHLKYEIKSFTVSIIMPLVFLIWFLIAFLYEGDWYLFSRLNF